MKIGRLATYGMHVKKWLQEFIGKKGGNKHDENSYNRRILGQNRLFAGVSTGEHEPEPAVRLVKEALPLPPTCISPFGFLGRRCNVLVYSAFR